MVPIRTVKQNYRQAYNSLNRTKGVDKKAEALNLAESWLNKLQREPYKSAIEEAIRKTEHLNPDLDDLISTIDEVMQIQDEGRQKREEAQIVLQKMEDDLKNKLMEITQ